MTFVQLWIKRWDFWLTKVRFSLSYVYANLIKQFISYMSVSKHPRLTTNYITLYTWLSILSNPDILNTQHDDTYLCVLPLSHVFALCVLMFIGFRYGATIVTMAKFDPVSFVAYVQKYRVWYELLYVYIQITNIISNLRERQWLHKILL